MLLAHLLDPFDLVDEFWDDVEGQRGEIHSKFLLVKATRTSPNRDPHFLMVSGDQIM